MEEKILIKKLTDALEHSRVVIQEWHGEPGWEIYLRNAPEMRVLNEAIKAAHRALKEG